MSASSETRGSEQLLGRGPCGDGRGHVGLMRWKTNQLAAARSTPTAAKEPRGEGRD